MTIKRSDVVPLFAVAAFGIGVLVGPPAARADMNPEARSMPIHDPVPRAKRTPRRSTRVRPVYIRCFTPNGTSLRLQVSSDRAACSIYGLADVRPQVD